MHRGTWSEDWQSCPVSGLFALHSHCGLPLPRGRGRPQTQPLTLYFLLSLTLCECNYLEVLAANISTPRVEDVQIEYLMPEMPEHWDEPPVEVEAREISQLIDRTGYLGFAQFSRAQVTFDVRRAHIKLDRPQGEHHQAQFSLTPRYTAPLPLAKLNFSQSRAWPEYLASLSSCSLTWAISPSM